MGLILKTGSPEGRLTRVAQSKISGAIVSRRPVELTKQNDYFGIVKIDGREEKYYLSHLGKTWRKMNTHNYRVWLEEEKDGN